jgi:hypothetical protein
MNTTFENKQECNQTEPIRYQGWKERKKTIKAVPVTSTDQEETQKRKWVGIWYTG